MGNVFFAYLGRRILIVAFSIIMITTVVLLLTQISVQLSRVASGRVMPEWIMLLILLHIPQIAWLIIPVGFAGALSGVMSASYANQQMVVVHAFGVSFFDLVRHLLYVPIILMFFSFLLVAWFNPKAIDRVDEMFALSERADIMHFIPKEQFFYLGNDMSLYVNDVDQANTGIEALLVMDADNQETVVVAQNMRQLLDDTHQYFELQDGIILTWPTNDTSIDREVVVFNDFYVHQPLMTPILQEPDLDAQTLFQLWPKRDDKEVMLEILHRISIVFLIAPLFVLTLAQVALLPRQSPNIIVLISSVVAVTYFGVNEIIFALTKADEIPIWIVGLLHAMMCVFAGFYFLRKGRIF